MKRQPYDVVGYTWFADVRCPEHAPAKGRRDPEGNPRGPIFRSSEWDYLPHCEVCGEPIEVRVIGGARA